MYQDITRDLRQAYDLMAEERDRRNVVPWKAEERQRFFSLLQSEGKMQLLDVGAGTGIHGKFFQDSGLDVVCADLSPELVKLCRRKGLTAYVMDFLNLAFPEGSLDAAFALNSLLHVPKNELPRALSSVRDVLKPGGLFYWGQYGGFDSEATWSDDTYEPKRFFSHLTDDQMRRFAGEFFELMDFRQIHREVFVDFYFQAMVLRKGCGRSDFIRS